MKNMPNIKPSMQEYRQAMELHSDKPNPDPAIILSASFGKEAKSEAQSGVCNRKAKP